MATRATPKARPPTVADATLFRNLESTDWYHTPFSALRGPASGEGVLIVVKRSRTDRNPDESFDAPNVVVMVVVTAIVGQPARFMQSSSDS